MVNYPQSRGGRNLGSGGGSRVGAISYDSSAIKNSFLIKTKSRRAQNDSRDTGYFSGGRCGWGAGHNFDEDVQKLVGVFNKVADMSNAIASLKECSSSEQFLTHKNSLLAKANQALTEMNIGAIESNVGYSGGLCIIWEDYTSSFLTPYITSFTNDLNSQIGEINGLNYEALVELEKLQLEQQQIKNEIEETYRKHEAETDPNKKAELYQHMMNLKKEFDEVGQKITANPWNKANNYDYSNSINQLIAMLEGKANPNSSPPPNKTPNPNVPNQTPTGPGRSSNFPPNYPGGKNNPFQPNQPSQNQSQLDQQTMIIFAVVALAIIFLLMNQKDSPSRPSHYDDYY
ncbi:hypothetical protein [endosymbiont GvMRE of Glomus versiforme]|uniref:hypothetical protein n=1 Tax=endosymbiont GvMRE of Glomus versiforme TaxID=2039283 RepID=UPI000EC1AD43|nr:hypothetical protein [endosymbiont GvMRE of Glomus versiforme]RHZ35895.1 hypothetical protein GvMRE_Ic4g124 [endosymbiont GvMRE of Glomus versiforme]